MLDASAIHEGTVLVEVDGKDQVQVVSYNSCFFNENEEKIAIIFF